MKENEYTDLQKKVMFMGEIDILRFISYSPFLYC